jgi:integrase
MRIWNENANRVLLMTTPAPKRRTRGQGEGSIYQRKSDGMWVAAVNLGWKDGKRDRRYFYGKTRKDASEKLTEALGKRQQGLSLNSERLTVAQFLDSWLEDEVRPTREPKTYESYESTIRLHISPDLGRHQLAKLTPQHVQALLRRKEDAGLSARSVQYMRTVLRTALARAEKWELVSRNVAALVDSPKVEHIEIRPWTQEEAEAFLNKAKPDRLGPLFSVALALGLRKAEALGLQWADVDLDDRRLYVRHQLQRIKGRGLVLKTPKTAKSRRVLPLPDPTVVALRAHKVKQLEERLLAGPRWKETDFVFTTSIGTPIEPTNVNKHFNRLVAAAGVPKQRFHDQRHWCATLLLAQGVAPRVVMELLGHTQISTTMDLYGHVLDEDRRAAADLMGHVLSRPTGGKEREKRGS